MAKKATHSPLPWQGVDGDHLIMDNDNITVLDLSDDGEDVEDGPETSDGYVSSARAELNKELIVKAVNAHDELVEASRRALSNALDAIIEIDLRYPDIQKTPDWVGDMRDQWVRTRDDARRALTNLGEEV